MPLDCALNFPAVPGKYLYETYAAAQTVQKLDERVPRPFLILNYDVACKCCFAKVHFSSFALTHNIGYPPELIVDARVDDNFPHTLSVVAIGHTKFVVRRANVKFSR